MRSSGALYHKVETSFLTVRVVSTNSRARPKSPSLHVISLKTRMLAGFKSRCTTLIECKYSTPSKISRVTRTTMGRLSDRFCFLMMTCRSVNASSNTITVESAVAPTMQMMLGCLPTRRIISISRLNASLRCCPGLSFFASSGSKSASGHTTLTTTSCLVSSTVACHTPPYAPLPIFSDTCSVWLVRSPRHLENQNNASCEPPAPRA